MMNIPTDQILKDFESSYHKYMLDKNKGKDPEYFDNGLHVSTIGYCKRRSVFEYFGFDKREIPLTTLTTFARGNDVHHEVQEVLKASLLFEVILMEHDVSDGLPDGVKGRLDFIINYLPTGVRILLDVKSANPNQFKTYMNTLPKPEHTNQVTHYANACDKLKIPYDILAVIYLDKGGTNKSQMFFFPKSLEADFLMEQDLKAIEGYKNDKTIPPYDLSEKDGKWKCNYCLYYEVVCKGKDEK